MEGGIGTQGLKLERRHQGKGAQPFRGDRAAHAENSFRRRETGHTFIDPIQLRYNRGRILLFSYLHRPGDRDYPHPS